MTIECSLCGSDTWCLRYEGEWFCKQCFMEEGHDAQEWQSLNDEAKAARQRKRIQRWEEDHVSL